MSRRYPGCPSRLSPLEPEPALEACEEAMSEAQTEREEAEADFFHDQEPGRWGDHASPARMRRDRERDREEERYG